MKKYIPVLLLFLATDSFAQQLFTEPLGIQAYTFRRSFPANPVAVLDTIKMMGFKYIEGGSGKLSLAEFRKLCEERGLSVPSTGASYEQLVQQPDSVVYRAKALGSSYVMCAWIPHNGAFTLANAQQAAADFNKAGKILAANGLTLCYHAHGYEFQPYEQGTLLDYLIANTDPKYVSFEMDIFWIQFGGGDPVSLLNKYGSRWKLMHLKDMRKGIQKDLSGGTSQENDVVLGTGELDIPGILSAAKKAGIKYYFIEDESSMVHRQVPESVAYLRALK